MVRTTTSTAVTELIDGYHIIVVTDHGPRESTTLLKVLAALTARILRLSLGSVQYAAKVQSNKNLFSHIGRMAPLLATAAKLCRNRQSFLVQATDRVLLTGPLGEDNRQTLRGRLARGCARSAPEAFHALLFARGKLAASWARDPVREGAVLPPELLLLNLVRCAIRREARSKAKSAQRERAKVAPAAGAKRYAVSAVDVGEQEGDEEDQGGEEEKGWDEGSGDDEEQEEPGDPEVHAEEEEEEAEGGMGGVYAAMLRSAELSAEQQALLQRMQARRRQREATSPAEPEPELEPEPEPEPEPEAGEGSDGESSDDGWESDDDDDQYDGPERLRPTALDAPAKRRLHLQLQPGDVRTTPCDVVFGRVDAAMCDPPTASKQSGWQDGIDRV
eukprot:COSAG04_NODE_1071_length_8472_cov_5.953661_3_plen_389_part_00